MLPHQQTPPADPPGVLKQRYVNAASLLAWGAYAALVYVVLVRGLQLARDTAFPLTIGKIGLADINPPIQLWFPLFPVAFALALLLPLATKYCIAFIVSIKGKDALSRWAKGILIVITGACIVSTLTATGPLMIESYSGKYREAAVASEQIEANIRAKDAEIKAIREQLAVLTEEGSKRPSIEAKAAREGAAGWPDKVKIAEAQAKAGQPNIDVDRFQRAQSAATSADAMRADIIKKIGEKAALPTASTAVSTVKSDESHGAQEFAEVSSAYWPMISFFALEMIAVFFGLIELVLMMTRDRQLADWAAVNAAPVPEAGVDTLAIEDQTDQWQVQPQDIQYDEHGNELVKVRRKKEEYYRRKSVPKKPKKDDPRAAQMFDGLSEGEQNPQSEVSDVAEEQGYQAQVELEAVHDPHVRSGFGEAALEQSGAYGNAGDAGSNFGLGSRSDSLEAESLTHAEEDQQADEPSANGGFELGGSRVDEIEHTIQSQDAEAFTLDEVADAPLPPPDEQALWTETPETEEPANDGSETLLPDGEGVLVRTEEEIEDLERRYAARRAATEAAE